MSTYAPDVANAVDWLSIDRLLKRPRAPSVSLRDLLPALMKNKGARKMGSEGQLSSSIDSLICVSAVFPFKQNHPETKGNKRTLRGVKWEQKASVESLLSCDRYTYHFLQFWSDGLRTFGYWWWLTLLTKSGLLLHIFHWLYIISRLYVKSCKCLHTLSKMVKTLRFLPISPIWLFPDCFFNTMPLYSMCANQSFDVIISRVFSLCQFSDLHSNP